MRMLLQCHGLKRAVNFTTAKLHVRAGAYLGAGFLAAIPATHAVEPAEIQLGHFHITPTIESRLGYIDNLLRNSEEDKGSWAMSTSPRVEAALYNGPHTYTLAYSLDDYRFFDSSKDDYTDQQVNLDIHQEFNARNALDLSGEFFTGSERRGTGLSEGNVATLIDKPVDYDETSYGGNYTYGSQSSRGRLEFGAEARSLEYQNFRDVTRYRDRDQDELRTTFFWNIAPRTDALAGVGYTDNHYSTDNPNDPFGTLDSEQFSYFVGLTWEATGKTSGSVRAGMFDRQYDSDARRSQDGFLWDVDVTWVPRSYSRFNFRTRRDFRETNRFGDAIDSRTYAVTWDYDWSSRSRTRLEVELVNDDYVDARNEDDAYTVEFEYIYAFRRWLDFGAGYRYEKRDSNIDSLEYELNAYYVEATMSL